MYGCVIENGSISPKLRNGMVCSQESVYSTAKLRERGGGRGVRARPRSLAAPSSVSAAEERDRSPPPRRAASLLDFLLRRKHARLHSPHLHVIENPMNAFLDVPHAGAADTPQPQPQPHSSAG